jgi:hypothetical protein
MIIGGQSYYYYHEFLGKRRLFVSLHQVCFRKPKKAVLNIDRTLCHHNESCTVPI